MERFNENTSPIEDISAVMPSTTATIVPSKNKEGGGNTSERTSRRASLVELPPTTALNVNSGISMERKPSIPLPPGSTSRRTTPTNFTPIPPATDSLPLESGKSSDHPLQNNIYQSLGSIPRTTSLSLATSASIPRPPSTSLPSAPDTQKDRPKTFSQEYDATPVQLVSSVPLPPQPSTTTSNIFQSYPLPPSSNLLSGQITPPASVFVSSTPLASNPQSFSQQASQRVPTPTKPTTGDGATPPWDAWTNFEIKVPSNVGQLKREEKNNSVSMAESAPPVKAEIHTDSTAYRPNINVEPPKKTEETPYKASGPYKEFTAENGKNVGPSFSVVAASFTKVTSSGPNSSNCGVQGCCCLKYVGMGNGAMANVCHCGHGQMYHTSLGPQVGSPPKPALKKENGKGGNAQAAPHTSTLPSVNAEETADACIVIGNTPQALEMLNLAMTNVIKEMATVTQAIAERGPEDLDDIRERLFEVSTLFQSLERLKEKHSKVSRVAVKTAWRPPPPPMYPPEYSSQQQQHIVEANTTFGIPRPVMSNHNVLPSMPLHHPQQQMMAPSTKHRLCSGCHEYTYSGRFCHNCGLDSGLAM